MVAEMGGGMNPGLADEHPERVPVQSESEFLNGQLRAGGAVRLCHLVLASRTGPTAPYKGLEASAYRMKKKHAFERTSSRRSYTT
jgi:hypothetical protein